jgi:hypothetical protein
LTYPLPSPSHANYRFYTPGGGDERWLCSEDVEEDGLQWVGGSNVSWILQLLLYLTTEYVCRITAQILGPNIHSPNSEWAHLEDLGLVVGLGRSRYASFSWPDLWAIAPWIEDRITKKIDGPGLGN